MTGRHIDSNHRRKLRQTARAGATLSLAALSLAIPLAVAPPLESSAVFTDTQTAAGNVLSADTLKAPLNVTAVSAPGGVAKLSWQASASPYAAGYIVYRSASAYGPWATVGTTAGRASTAFTDSTSGAQQWFYRVEAQAGNWVSTGQAFAAPPPVGREFFDGFNGTGLLNGRPTEDGSSTWLVWSGSVDTHWTNVGTEYAAYGSADGQGVAVVRTPSTDAILYAEDFDGHEALILRGKDPQNYIYAGGVGVNGQFHIIEVRNGQRTILKSDLSLGTDQNIRLEIRGTTIKVYKNAVRGNATSGTLFMTVTTNFLAGDPTATYFGIGFANERYGINDFTFTAL